MDQTELIENRTFDEIAIGESASLERTVTKQDIELYATVSGDANPTHLDETFAKQAKFKGTVAHSMFSAGLISSVLGNRLPGAGTVYLAQELRFAAPVYAGDTITVTVTAREKRAAERIVRFDCTCVNQDGQTVLDGVATVIAPAEKLSAPAITLATASVQRHDSYRLAAGPCRRASRRSRARWRTHATRARCAARVEAAAARLMVPILVGPADKIRDVAQQFGLDIGQLELVDVPHSHAAAAKAVELVRAGKAELLMKGSLHTDELMGEVVAKETGLRTARRISHVFIMDVPTYPYAAVHHRRRDQHRPRPRRPRSTSSRTRSTCTSGWAWASRAWPSCRRSRRSTRRCPARSTPRPCARWPTAARSRAACSTARWRWTTRSARRRRGSRASSRRWRARRRSWWCPTSRPATCWPRTCRSWPTPTRPGIVLGARVPIILTSRADNVRTRMASCAVAALYAHARREAAAAAAAA